MAVVVRKAKNGRYYRQDEAGGRVTWLSHEEGTALARRQRDRKKKAATRKAASSSSSSKPSKKATPRRRARYITD